MEQNLSFLDIFWKRKVFSGKCFVGKHRIRILQVCQRQLFSYSLALLFQKYKCISIFFLNKLAKLKGKIFVLKKDIEIGLKRIFYGSLGVEWIHKIKAPHIKTTTILSFTFYQITGLLPCCWLLAGEYFIFHEERASCYTSILMKMWFQELKFKLFKRTENSPEFKIILNVLVIYRDIIIQMEVSSLSRQNWLFGRE